MLDWRNYRFGLLKTKTEPELVWKFKSLYFSALKLKREIMVARETAHTSRELHVGWYIFPRFLVRNQIVNYSKKS